jgi:PAS domain S-box-containing protein
VEFRALIDVVPEHIVLHNAEMHVLHYNRVALDYFGCTLEEMLSGRYLQTLHPDDLEELVMKSAMACARGSVLSLKSVSSDTMGFPLVLFADDPVAG